jgi:hypothetical protein
MPRAPQNVDKIHVSLLIYLNNGVIRYEIPKIVGFEDI